MHIFCTAIKCITPESPKLPGCHVMVSPMVPQPRHLHGLERENNPDRANFIARSTQVAKGDRKLFNAKLWQDTVLLLFLYLYSFHL